MIKKFAVGFIVGTLFLNVSAVSLVEATFKGKDGHKPWKKSGVSISCSTKVYQTAVTEADVEIDQDASTGDNKIKGNTGGGALIDTGDVDQYAKVKVYGGSNFASVPCGCGCDGGVGGVDGELTLNGGHPKKHLNLHVKKSTHVNQVSVTDADVEIEQEADTGDNKIENNTGKKKYYHASGGSAEILTGDIDQTAKVSVSGGSNAVVSGGFLH